MAPKRSPHDQLVFLQKKIYRSLQAQVEKLLGETPEAIRRYEREYRDEFRKIARKPQRREKSELIQAMRRHDVTLIGDFHTFWQAQRTALRLLREAAHPGENWFLGLEMFSSDHQESLDRFQLGEISEERFLKETDYENQWGFSWKQYAPILRWAIAHRVRLIALNRPSGLKRNTEGEAPLENELYERDRWAAGIITDLFSNSRKAGVHRARIVVLYGELHIARKHLPALLQTISKDSLKRPLRTLRVHQNNDSLYWKIAQAGIEHRTDIIQLQRRSYCVLSSPPWAKLQSLVSWTEGALPELGMKSAENEDGDDDDSDEEHETDFHSLMREYGGVQAEFFKLEKPSLEDLDVYTIRHADFVGELSRDRVCPRNRRLLKYHIVHHHRLYLPDSRLAYLATPTENAAAEIAAIHLLCSHRNRAPEKRNRSPEFYEWIMESAFGFWGSLIINPKRKCDLVEDHELRIRALKGGDPATFPDELAARELTVAFLTEDPDITRLDSYLKKPVQLFALYFSARYIGYALAKRIHPLVLDGSLELSELVRKFVSDPEEGAPLYWRFSTVLKEAFRREGASTKQASL